MTWEELKEEAKKMGYDDCYTIYEGVEWLSKGNYSFDKDGTVMYDGRVMALDRTPDQMLAIMKALQ